MISRANGFRDLLQNALTLDGTLTANRQNEASAAGLLMYVIFTRKNWLK
ncbi:hypothetical protein [Arthrobacter sp. MMS18-M83]|nr:hypothetical protein [Arthrobacter sp. MMS18-M83]WAH96371.1 hypothetical protein OW521_18415 [Arthrobacter sp. MMS18-M83]